MTVGLHPISFAPVIDAPISLPPIDAAMIEQLALKTHPRYAEIERTLVLLARGGRLAGIVTKPARYSATTIQWHEECARKFYWPAVAGLEDPPSPEQAEGTLLHKLQEDWLKEGKTPPQTTRAGRLAMKGAVHLPAPKAPGLRVEENFELQIEGVPVIVTGQVDFSRDPVTPDGAPDYAAKGFLLGDHKTKKNKRYPKTKPWLQGNIQSNLYAYARWGQLLGLGYDNLSVVDKQWIYYFKTEEMTEKLRSVDGLDHVAEQVETVIKPNLLSMARMVREVPKIGDVPAADKSVCEAYFGCPHIQRCWGMGSKEGTPMGVVAGNFSKQNIAAKAQGIKSAPAAGAGTKINPPAARPAPVRTVAPAPEPIEEEVYDPDQAALEAAELEAAQEQAAAAEAQAAAAAAPAKRARKPKAAQAAQPATQATQEEEGTTTTPTRSQRTPGANSGHNFWLFIGCRPTFGFSVEPMPIEHLVGGAQADAAAGNDAQHYRDRNSYGALESAFAKWMEENAIVGAVTVDPDTIVARDVIGLLRAHATATIERSM